MALYSHPRVSGLQEIYKSQQFNMYRHGFINPEELTHTPAMIGLYKKSRKSSEPHELGPGIVRPCHLTKNPCGADRDVIHNLIDHLALQEMVSGDLLGESFKVYHVISRYCKTSALRPSLSQTLGICLILIIKNTP